MKIPVEMTRFFGRSGLLFKKHSPEILMVFGIAGVVGSTVLACRATLKCEATLERAKKNIKTINVCWEKVQTGEIKKTRYTEQDKQKDLVVAYTKAAGDFIKLYGPAVALGVVSITCLIGSHRIISKRNIALMAAYKTLEEGFNSYRKRIAAEAGEDREYAFKNGLQAEDVVEKVTGEDGKTKKVKRTKYKVSGDDPNQYSVYARFFDESCSQWSKTPEYNLMFLRSQQNYFNDMLKARGHVFLNEVYDALGITRSQAGSVVGWVIGDGDNYIDFGIFDGGSAHQRAFVNGDERSILLDFNVDGVIYDLI